MREDPGVDLFAVIVIIFGALVALAESFRPGVDDPNWELRQRGLDPEYRNWLAAMATSYRWLGTLEDPQEIALARGFERRERRRGAYLDLVAAAVLILGLALMLAGLIPGSTLSFALSIYLVVRAVAMFIRNHRIRRRLAVRSDSEAAPPRQGTAPA